MGLSRAQRRRILAPGTLDGATPYHRSAVLAGAPSRIATGLAGDVADLAKRSGVKPHYVLSHPGCEGHERCSDTCVEYLP